MATNNLMTSNIFILLCLIAPSLSSNCKYWKSNNEHLYKLCMTTYSMVETPATTTKTTAPPTSTPIITTTAPTPTPLTTTRTIKTTLSIATPPTPTKTTIPAENAAVLSSSPSPSNKNKMNWYSIFLLIIITQLLKS